MRWPGRSRDKFRHHGIEFGVIEFAADPRDAVCRLLAIETFRELPYRACLYLSGRLEDARAGKRRRCLRAKFETLA